MDCTNNTTMVDGEDYSNIKDRPEYEKFVNSEYGEIVELSDDHVLYEDGTLLFIYHP